MALRRWVACGPFFPTCGALLGPVPFLARWCAACPTFQPQNDMHMAVLRCGGSRDPRGAWRTPTVHTLGAHTREERGPARSALIQATMRRVVEHTVRHHPAALCRGLGWRTKQHTIPRPCLDGHVYAPLLRPTVSSHAYNIADSSSGLFAIRPQHLKPTIGLPGCDTCECLGHRSDLQPQVLLYHCNRCRSRLGGQLGGQWRSRQAGWRHG